MTLSDGMLLYHGSYTMVEEISLTMCSKGKDFGRGFYLTSSIEQAQSFIRTSLKKAKRLGNAPDSQTFGYITVFRYQESEGDQSIYRFDEANREWLWFISQNRREKLAEVLTGVVDPNINKSDIIIGKIANDTTNPVITAYLNGLYGDILSEAATDFAIKQLMPEHLIDQYCFLTEKAIKCLKFQEAVRYDICKNEGMCRYDSGNSN